MEINAPVRYELRRYDFQGEYYDATETKFASYEEAEIFQRGDTWPGPVYIARVDSAIVPWRTASEQRFNRQG